MMLWTVTKRFAVGQLKTSIAIAIVSARDKTEAEFEASSCGITPWYSNSVELNIYEGIDLNDPIVAGVFNRTLLERVIESADSAKIRLFGQFIVDFKESKDA